MLPAKVFSEEEAMRWSKVATEFAEIFGVQPGDESSHPDYIKLVQLVVRGKLVQLVKEAEPCFDGEYALQHSTAIVPFIPPSEAERRVAEWKEIRAASETVSQRLHEAQDAARAAGYKVGEYGDYLKMARVPGATADAA